jgi:hypothetical protein
MFYASFTMYLPFWLLIGSRTEQIHKCNAGLSRAASSCRASHLYESLGLHVCGTEPRALRGGSQYFDEHLMFVQF